MTPLSQLLNERLPEGWTGDNIAQEAEKHGEQINRATAFAYLAGDHGKRPSEGVLRAFAAALPVTVAELRTAADLPAGENAPWTPPPEANRLNDRQRQALEELIRAIAAPTRGVVPATGLESEEVDVAGRGTHLSEDGEQAPDSGRRKGRRRAR